MHEYRVLKTAPTSEKLTRTLKSEDLSKFGEPFTPEFVYDAIRQLDRFASMIVITTQLAFFATTC
jgi:ubiquitin carboxyl-terminal hydrolase 10